ncbi:MAG: hypothetical protein QOJ13_303 [Gaiellales bacterium]|nr:hypothetical protein [Gaiellales bacterium]
MATTPYGVRLAESAPSEMGDRTVTAVLSRTEIEQAARSDQAELMLDIHRGEGPDVQAHTLSVVWTREELERLLDADSNDELTLSFDREQLEQALDIDADVEAHGLRQKALIFTVLVGTAAVAPTMAQAMPDSGGAGTAAVSQPAPAVLVGGAVSADIVSAAQVAPAVLTGGATAAADQAVASGPGMVAPAVLTGGATAAADQAVASTTAPAVLTGGATAAADQAVASGPGMIAPAVLTGGATAAADQAVGSGPGDIAPAVLTGGAVSAAQQSAAAAQPPAVVTGGALPQGATAPATQPIATSTPGSSGIDPTDALLIGGGAALAIAAAGFAATRRPDAPRPA